MFDRGQINTLEAFIAALILVGGLLFASQATAVTPLSASTSNQHIENQQQANADDLLTIAAEEGTLAQALTYWNVSDEEPVDAHWAHADPESGTYSMLPTAAAEQHPLHDLLEMAFDRGAHAFNLEIVYQTPDGGVDTKSIVHQGTPSDNAVSARKTVALFGSEPISYEDSEYDTVAELADNAEFWTEDIDDDIDLFTTVEVRITVWRM